MFYYIKPRSVFLKPFDKTGSKRFSGFGLEDRLYESKLYELKLYEMQLHICVEIIWNVTEPYV